MKYAIVYNSKTGNTQLLAEKLQHLLPEGDCVYNGAPDEKATDADLIYVGFWTDKGSCDESTAYFLESLEGKKIFLFGTAGFGGSEEYFEKILSHVKQYLKYGNTVEGTYMCQGKMPITVRQRYETMLSKDPKKMANLIINFDLALSHPDAADLEGLEQVAMKSNCY